MVQVASYSNNRLINKKNKDHVVGEKKLKEKEQKNTHALFHFNSLNFQRNISIFLDEISFEAFENLILELI